MASVTTANIGTPSTNAANIRCTSAAIHTAARAPMTGNSPYARVVSAAAWTSSRAPAGISRRPRGKTVASREVDRQRAPDLREQFGRHLAAAVAARPILDPRDHDPAHEGRDPLEPLPRRRGPRERGLEVGAVRHLARRLDQRGVARRFVGARRVGGEHVPLERERPRPAPAAPPAVFAAAALPAERALSRPAE